MKYNQTTPEFATALMLLSYSSMTTLSCISSFISVDKRTVLHSDPTILDEIQTFLETVRKKKDEHGELWPYHRVLYPDDGDLDANKFPNLAVASVTYYHEYGPATYKQVIIPKVATSIDNLRIKAITTQQTKC